MSTRSDSRDQSHDQFSSQLATRRRTNERRIYMASALAIVVLGALAWQRSKNAPGAAPVAAVLTSAANAATPTPRPTPKPTPLNAIAPWAKSRVINDVSVKPGQKVVALTFDDGPWPQSTAQVLQVLRDNNIKASFFMVGQEVMRRPDVARQVRDAGHAIGNHSWDHPSRPRSPVSQVVRTDAIIKKELGFTPTFFRPPYGILKNGMARRAMIQGDPVLLWSADSTDWSRPGSATIASRVLREVHPGGIVLMHDGGGPRAQTVAALPIIISTLRNRGYSFVTVPELLRMRYVAPKMVKPKKAPKEKLKTSKTKTSTSSTR